MHLKTHGVQFFRALSDQLQGQFPGLDALLLRCIIKGPLDLLLLLVGAQARDFLEQLRVSCGKALQRNGLTGFFCNHDFLPAGA